LDATISETAMPAPMRLQRLRKGRSVTPAMGATTRLLRSWTLPIFTMDAVAGFFPSWAARVLGWDSTEG
jgi:hypothetical protein